MRATLQELRDRLVEAEAQVSNIKAAINFELAKTLVRCEKCKLGFEVRELTYIQTHWYTSPHGCSGGDYWNQGEGRWKCSCSFVNRLHNQREIMDLKPLFKDVQNTYDR